MPNDYRASLPLQCVCIFSFAESVLTPLTEMYYYPSRDLISKTKIMASSPITSGQIDRETMETVKDFIFLGSKINADGDCSHEIKRCLFLGKKAKTNLDSILKSKLNCFTSKGSSYGFSSCYVWI